MLASFFLPALGLSTRVLARTCAEEPPAAANSTFHNPILPGFHPDPSCVFVPEWDETYFCAASSFNAFPGLPIHASKDLQDWRSIGGLCFLSSPGLTGLLRGQRVVSV